MKKSVRIFVFALVFLVVVIAGIKVILLYREQQIRYQAQEDYWREQAAQVYKQREIWQKQGITKYRIGIIWSTFSGSCSEEFVVNNKVVTQIIKNCEYYPNLETVEDLFLKIENMISERKCGGNGCGCDGPLHIDAVYDELYGFPKTGRSVIHPQQSWRYGTQTFCTLVGTGGPQWEVYSFSPLP